MIYPSLSPYLFVDFIIHRFLMGCNLYFLPTPLFSAPFSRKWEKSYIPNQLLRFRTRKADSPDPSTYGPGGAVGGAVFAVIRCRCGRVLPVFCGGVGVVVLWVLVVLVLWCGDLLI
jgi:hypothetical protein